jgi:hypothetical protein
MPFPRLDQRLESYDLDDPGNRTRRESRISAVGQRRAVVMTVKLGLNARGSPARGRGFVQRVSGTFTHVDLFAMLGAGQVADENFMRQTQPLPRQHHHREQHPACLLQTSMGNVGGRHHGMSHSGTSPSRESQDGLNHAKTEPPVQEHWVASSPSRSVEGPGWGRGECPLPAASKRAPPGPPRARRCSRYTSAGLR